MDYLTTEFKKLNMKYILPVMALMICSITMQAQAPGDLRTTTTKIADLLARMPAQDKKSLNIAMESIAAIGEDGLTTLTGMLAAPNKGDNTKLEYAIANYSYYTTSKGNEALRKRAVQSYLTALANKADKETKAFIIRQLEITGTDDAVVALQAYLQDERLVDPAARALVKIHTTAAGKALADALASASSNLSKTLTEALGDIQYLPAATAIGKQSTSTDAALVKVSLYALAQIGSPASENVLATAAAKAGYKYDITGATTSYISYARQLHILGNPVLAEKIANALLKNASSKEQVPARTAGLKLLVEIKGEKALPILVNLLNDPSPAFREAALKFALPYNDKNATTLLLKKLAAVENNKTVKAGIIAMLGNSNQVAAQSAIFQALNDKDAAVRLSAITAAGQVGQDKAVPVLLELLKKDNAAEALAVKNTLLTIRAEGLENTIANALNTEPTHAKVALIEVLAAKGANSRVNDVLALANSSDTLVKRSALIALSSLVTPSILPQLYPFLYSANKPSEIKAAQEAIVAASAGIKDSEQRTNTIVAEFKKAAVDKQPLFLDIFAGIGSPSALQLVIASLQSGDAATKIASVNALAKWPNANAAEALFQALLQPNNAAIFDQAFAGYIHLVNTSKYPDDQILLLLRRAMPIAKTVAQKQSVLDGVAFCNSFVALVYAGSYLDDADLQQQAAHAVLELVSDNKSWKGAIVKRLIEKTIEVLKGQDSDYQKQALRKQLAELTPGEGIVRLFNGKDLTGWKGLVANPIERFKMHPDTLAVKQQEADLEMRKSWYAKDGILEFNGSGENLCTVKKYGDFEMFVDWKIDPDGDAGIYLRGSPQVQIWDTSRRDVGAQVGSGGLYNNSVYERNPLKLADNAIGEWNSFHIIMKGDRVTVYLNGVLVVDNVILENYWDRSLPIFAEEQIELQAHGRHVSYRDLYIREIPHPVAYNLSEDEKKDGFQLLFDGTNMHEWTGNTTEYNIENGNLVVRPREGNHGNLYTKKEFSDFVYRFEFQLTPGANNGIGIRAPLDGDAAYVGMEIQVLDNEADIYKDLHVYQYHGSVYGVIPAKRGFLKPLGEWNAEEITAIGTHIKVVLNGTVILDGDISDAIQNGTLDKRDHPGLKNKEGHIGFLGHGDVVSFRHIRVKDLAVPPPVAPPTQEKKKKKK